MAKPKVDKICRNCQTQFQVAFKYRNRGFYCSQQCSREYMKGENSPTFGKTYRTKETHPEWAASIRKTTKERAINSGDNNGMKREDVRQRQSQTRRERVTSNPEYRKARSDDMRQAWADGKYDGVK